MRYDKLLTQLERARAAYEDTVRGLIADAARGDAQVAEALKSVGEKPKRKYTRRKLLTKRVKR